MSLPGAIVTIAGAPVECDVLRATMRHGRDDPGSEPEADTATLDVLGVLPSSAVIGADVAVFAVLIETYPRFAGRITDIAVSWESVDVSVATIIAVGELADMGRREIGATPYPAELDGTRVNRAIADAGVATDPIRSDPGYLTVLARDVDAQPALTIASDAAFDGGGIVWMATDGAVLYADAMHRRAPELALTLTACDLPLSLTWLIGLEGLANDVRVRYGAPEAEIHATNPGSIAEYGTLGASLSTRLVDAAAATERANLIIARQGEPVWTLGAMRVALQSPGVDAALTADLLALEVHDLMQLTGMPAGAPMTGAIVFVEGWTETIEPGAWELALAVSDYCRTVPAPAWDDVSPGWAWDGIDPGLTWDSITCLPPFVSDYPGRWVDVPASERWDTVAAAITWDTWAQP